MEIQTAFYVSIRAFCLYLRYNRAILRGVI